MNSTVLVIVGLLPAVYLVYLAILPKPIPGIPYNAASVRSVLGDTLAIKSHIAMTDGGTFMTYAVKMMRNCNTPLIQIFPQPLSKPVLILGDYQEAYEIFVRRSREFDRSHNVGNMFLGFIPKNHFLLRTNAAWKAQRRLVLASMNESFLYGTLAPAVQERVARVIELWRIKAEIARERPWSAAHELNMIALESIMAFTLGGGLCYTATEGAIEAVRRGMGKVDGLLQATLDMTATMGELRYSWMPRLKWPFVHRRQRVKNAVNVKEEYIRRELEKAVDQLQKGRETVARSAVDHMVAYEKNLAQKEGRLPDYFSRVMIDEITGLIIAGHETTGSTLCWAVKFLTDYPKVQSKLRLAIEAGFPAALKAARNPTIQEIINTDIPYLEATIQEILRFANPATAIDRVSLVDTEILGHAVPKDTIVVCMLPEPRLLRPVDISKKQLEDTSKLRAWDPTDMAHFRPERWIEYDQVNPMAAPQVAFGMGPRTCPGKRVAHLEISATLVAVLWNFELLSCPAGLSGYHQLLVATQKPKQCYTASAATVLSLSWLARSAAALPSSSAVVTATSTSVVPTATATSGFRSVAYFADWDIYNTTNFFPQNITASTLSHLIYCFANVDASTGSVGLSDVWADLQFPYPGDDSSDTSAVAGNIKQLYLMKQQNRNLKTLLSIGGATYSPNFDNFTLTAEGRQTFAKSAVELVQNLGFDGIDIDWEYPSDQVHAEAYTSLLQEVRNALTDYSNQWANGAPLLLSIAAPAGAQAYEIMDLSGMDKYLDFWNLMAYDYAGSWSDYSGDLANVYASKTNPNSTQTNTDDAISYYLSKGISASKINLGMPIYARTFPDTTGLGQPFNKTAAGEVNYNAIDTANANITELTDVIASYSYNSTADGTLYSFDTPKIAQLKTQYAQSKGIGGAMFWEISGDKVGEESIIGTVVNAIGGSSGLDQSQNLLAYPNSNYTNIRNQMVN
ncbi:hypothetical protein PISL3812_02031 [Talaromyces islandicus]|uniref:chitinase n=1 Tax=Talaromyces islandicus TaxID=28573 RepID=A0A0U1LR05_TALIS|nr:hypothetical protein PISL3812_02031 [Talaromyces islandicus]